MDDLHEQEVMKIRTRFSSQGVATRVMPRNNSPFDLWLANGIKVEVKVSNISHTSKTSNGIAWTFNIHRHGVAPKTWDVDFYILCIPAFSALGFKRGIRLIIPSSKIGSRKLISISARSLINQWAKYINNWKAIEELV